MTYSNRPGFDLTTFDLQGLTVIGSAVQALIDRISEAPEDHALVVAVAAHVHGFYTGVERIFEAVATIIDDGLPAGRAWHKTLLNSMAAPSAKRPQVISEDLRDQLARYLAFRHFFRHSFAHKLEWPLLQPLAADLEATVTWVTSDIRAFVAALPDAA
jgi:hypothetical protein